MLSPPIDAGKHLYSTSHDKEMCGKYPWHSCLTIVLRLQHHFESTCDRGHTIWSWQTHFDPTCDQSHWSRQPVVCSAGAATRLCSFQKSGSTKKNVLQKCGNMDEVQQDESVNLLKTWHKKKNIRCPTCKAPFFFILMGLRISLWPALNMKLS